MRSRLLLTVLVLAACSSDSLVDRMTRDNYPLRAGDQWRYTDRVSGATRYVEVGGDTVVLGRECTVVADNFEPTYWIRSAGAIDRFVEYTLIRNGTSFTLERRFARVALVPWVAGNSWQDAFADTVTVFGEPVAFEHRRSVVVLAPQPVTVPAGTFFAYRLRCSEVTVAGSDRDSLASEEWWAPGVGLVRRTGPGTDEVLTEYSVR